MKPVSESKSETTTSRRFWSPVERVKRRRKRPAAVPSVRMTQGRVETGYSTPGRIPGFSPSSTSAISRTPGNCVSAWTGLQVIVVDSEAPSTVIPMTRPIPSSVFFGTRMASAWKLMEGPESAFQRLPSASRNATWRPFGEITGCEDAQSTPSGESRAMIPETRSYRMISESRL